MALIPILPYHSHSCLRPEPPSTTCLLLSSVYHPPASFRGNRETPRRYRIKDKAHIYLLPPQLSSSMLEPLALYSTPSCSSSNQVLVPRENFQDLYLTLKDRHRHLDSRAPKPGSTKIEDVKRHVYKVCPCPLLLNSTKSRQGYRAYHKYLPSLHPAANAILYLLMAIFLNGVIRMWQLRLF